MKGAYLSMSTWNLKEKSTGDLKVSIEGEKWQKAQTKAFNKLAQDVELPGFRKGQAPKKMLEKAVSKSQVLMEAVYNVANELLVQGIEENDLVLVAQPTLDIESVSETECTLVFHCTVQPEAVLGEYKGLSYEVAPVEVSDEDVDAEIAKMQERYAEMEVKEDAAALNDTVVIDFEGFKDGVAFEGGKGENYNLVLGSGSFIPGFEEQLVGAKAGDEVEVNVTFPEQYQEPTLAGQPAVFKCKVHEVKTKVLPEVDDEFAKDVNIPEVETVEQLKAHIKEEQTKQRTTAAENEAMNALMQKVVDNATCEIPEEMIDEEAKQMINEFAGQLQQQGFSFSQFLKLSNQSLDDLKSSMSEEAANRIKTRLVLEAIAKAEHLEVSDEDLDKEFENMSTQYGMEVEEIKKYVSPEAVKLDLANQKAYEFIKDSAVK